MTSCDPPLLNDEGQLRTGQGWALCSGEQQTNSRFVRLSRCRNGRFARLAEATSFSAEARMRNDAPIRS